MGENINQPMEISIRSTQQSELISLANELAKVRLQVLEYFRTQYQLPPAEAEAKAQEALTVSEGEASDITCGPPQQATWYELECLAERDPYLMMGRWREVQQAAVDEVVGGHRAALAVASPTGDTPWARAQFLALRASFIAEWQPQGGVEMAILDTMAQAQTLYYHWVEVLVRETGTTTERRKSKYNSSGMVEPPRVSDVEAVEMAAEMADRFNRLFMRGVRQLRDLRRYATPPVSIQTAGQVNVGRQQVNVTDVSHGASGGHLGSMESKE